MISETSENKNHRTLHGSRLRPGPLQFMKLPVTPGHEFLHGGAHTLSLAPLSTLAAPVAVQQPIASSAGACPCQASLTTLLQLMTNQLLLPSWETGS